MWGFYGIIGIEWLMFFFGFISIKVYLGWFEVTRVWSISMLPAMALFLFGTSIYVEYMSGLEIMFAALNAFVVVPLVAIIHQANFKALRFVAFGRDELEEQQAIEEYNNLCEAGDDWELGYYCDE